MAMTREEFSQRVKDGQARSKKHQEMLARKAHGPWSREKRWERSTFRKGKHLSAWEKICGEVI